MELDVNTLFLVTMYVEIMLGLLLFFAWAQNFGKRALAWWGSAHLLRARARSCCLACTARSRFRFRSILPMRCCSAPSR